MNRSIRKDVVAALFAALVAVFTQLVIPIQPVPITLGSMAVLMAGAVLGARYGALSILIYVILGAAGLPVFAMARAGVSVLAGPGGGFIFGYIAGAAAVGFIAERKGYSMKWLIAALFVGSLVIYACGLAWFMALTGAGPLSAMTMCMFPFIPGDTVNIFLGSFLVNRYRKYIKL